MIHPTRPPRSGADFVKQVITSPWLWGGAAATVFYLAIPHAPVGRELLIRYCNSHPLEWVETGLFFVGLAIILTKYLALFQEKRALAAVPQLGPDPALTEFHDALEQLQNAVNRDLRGLNDTYWGRRLDHLLAFFRGRQNCDGLSSQLTYLSEAEADRLHNSHALLQTVIWSIPILGFLGTVMGITLAIANVTPEQLESSLNDVTGGLAVAFDTTAIALTYSLVLGFASLFIKRGEERLLSQIDEQCRLETHRCFPEGAAASHPLLQAEQAAAELLVRQTTAMIERQTHVWNQAVEVMREQWTQTVQEQRRSLVEMLQAGAQQTLAQHAESLAESRAQLLTAHDEMSRQLVADVQQMLEQRQRSEEATLTSLFALARQMTESIERQGQAQAEHVQQLLASSAEHVTRWENRADAWQRQLATLTDSLAGQSAAILDYGAQLERIANHEASLLRLQDQLNQNLESIRAAESFDETLHNLSAAVHLLTARARGRDAA